MGLYMELHVSLGFAALENIFYLLANGLHLALGRAILPVSSSALFGVIMGYYLGKGKFSANTDKKKWILYSLFIPIFLHGMYDYILLIGDKWMYLLVPFMIFLWWLGLRKVKKAKNLGGIINGDLIDEVN